MKIKIIKRENYLRIEKILKKEFIIRTIIFFLIALYFFINSFIKYGILRFNFQKKYLTNTKIFDNILLDHLVNDSMVRLEKL